MAMQLYVVTDEKTGANYLVCSKTRNQAMNYIAKSVLMKLCAEPATPVQVLLSTKNGVAVFGKEADLAAIGIGIE